MLENRVYRFFAEVAGSWCELGQGPWQESLAAFQTNELYAVMTREVFSPQRNGWEETSFFAEVTMVDDEGTPTGSPVANFRRVTSEHREDRLKRQEAGF